jgi:hypothetical protein
MKTRRVGTITCGIVLVLFGILFLLNGFLPMLNYAFIFRLWPLVLVSLGAELLLSARKEIEEKVKYDFGAIALVILLSVFSMAMGMADYVITVRPELFAF